MNASDEVSLSNYALVQEQIQFKVKPSPFMPSPKYINSIITDQDHFPYRRYYRGVNGSTTPHVFDREAGFRPIENDKYQYLTLEKPCNPRLCFHTSCNTVRPCRCDNETGSKLPLKNYQNYSNQR